MYLCTAFSPVDLPPDGARIAGTEAARVIPVFVVAVHLAAHVAAAAAAEDGAAAALPSSGGIAAEASQPLHSSHSITTQCSGKR